MKKLVTAPVSAKKFERIAEMLGPCELVRGEVVKMSPGGLEHGGVENKVAYKLSVYSERTKLGRVFTGEIGIIVARDPDTVRGADVLYISYKRLPKGKRWGGFLNQPPELVVEVLGQKDTWEGIEEKVSEYHAFGVDTVWVVDPQTLSLRVCPLGAEPKVLHGAEEVSGGRLLPGFRCKISESFED